MSSVSAMLSSPRHMELAALTAHDKRLHAFRPDLADARLKGEVAAERFVAGRPARIVAPVADMLRRAASGCRAEHAAPARRRRDRSSRKPRAGPGCRPSATVMSAMSRAAFSGRRDGRADPHRLRAAQFPLPRSGPQVSARSANCRWARRVTVTGFRRDARHALRAAVDRRGDDFGASAAGRRACRRLCRGRRDAADTPYLWGGTTAFGIDCSGLVQLAMRMTGRDVLRDTDMQAATIGEPIDRRAVIRAFGAATSSSGKAMSRS